MKAENQVVLRTPTPADVDEFLDFVRENRRFHRPWVYPPATRTAVLAYVKRCRRDDFAGFLVRRADDEGLIGVFNLSQIFRGGFQNAYLGYYGSARFQGRGYMTKALFHLVKHAFHDMKLHRLEANVQPGNAASVALLKRCGFRKEGFSPRYLKVGGKWRDHERWAITREDQRNSGLDRKR
jgi:[ribosomal protein S5]-alanine N-acetyltransferase